MQCSPLAKAAVRWGNFDGKPERPSKPTLSNAISSCLSTDYRAFSLLRCQGPSLDWFPRLRAHLHLISPQGFQGHPFKTLALIMPSLSVRSFDGPPDRPEIGSDILVQPANLITHSSPHAGLLSCQGTELLAVSIMSLMFSNPRLQGMQPFPQNALLPLST